MEYQHSTRDRTAVSVPKKSQFSASLFSFGYPLLSSKSSLTHNQHTPVKSQRRQAIKHVIARKPNLHMPSGLVQNANIKTRNKLKLDQTQNVFGKFHQWFTKLDSRFEINRGKITAVVVNCM
jgi:hypothetical protein